MIDSALFIRHDPIKRAFDLIFSLIFLILMAPFILLISLLIVATSKGPPVYRSIRLGQGGKAIYCLKFRTMYQDADKRLVELLQSDPLMAQEWNQFQKLKKDPRITRLGALLRRTSMDEVLQFWNVLKGEMSIVGPRPLTLVGPKDKYIDEVQSIYGKDTGTILSVRPGITGIWQVSGRSKVSLEQRQVLEKEYALNRNFITDIVIVAKTIPAVIFSKGAF